MSLKKWFDQKWVDIGSKRKDGSYAPCGRSKLAADRKRKYPKCVPAAKAARMTESQRRSAVARKELNHKESVVSQQMSVPLPKSIMVV